MGGVNNVTSSTDEGSIGGDVQAAVSDLGIAFLRAQHEAGGGILKYLLWE